MTDIVARIGNLYGGPWNGSQVASVVGQVATLTMDGDMNSPAGQTTIVDAALVDDDVMLTFSLPEGTKAAEIGRSGSREVNVGYIVESSRSIRLHTVAHESTAPSVADAPQEGPPVVTSEEVKDAEESAGEGA